jgi:2-polyprenyl-3-methyl-5-hydroxy-6-metoxy-1,4-benzoquinol methylase
MYKTINNCLCCLHSNKSLLDLGNIPLANDFNETKQSECFPLELMVCPNCYHCQLHCVVNPEILFKNYKYISGTSNTGLSFFKQNAEFITQYTNRVGKILDIACNDGSQLNYFKELGWETYGVDPATNLLEISQKNGHTVICDFWNEDVAKQFPIMDVITAQNVFAHTEYVDEFLQTCKLVMNENTILFIQTSQKNMIINSEFDTIYHEHISFFNTKSMDILVKRNGLCLHKIHEADIHGSSYIFEIKTQSDGNFIKENLLEEESNGMYSDELYNTFSLNSKLISKNLKDIIEDYRSKGYKCIGYGAAAKGQTVLCYAEIELDYIIDENPLKIGLFSPKMNIPIVDNSQFINNPSENYLIVILAWNFADEIIHKIKSINKNVIIIKSYFPEIKLC